jgi:predicted ATPase
VRIRTFRVVNYKSFVDSGELRLEPGFNVIVGRNNVGKTALAEAVGLHLLTDKPHRSLRTVPREGSVLLGDLLLVALAARLLAGKRAMIDEVRGEQLV